MAVIVLEGPDSSGKSTLSQVLLKDLSPVFQELEITRSPVKENGWSPHYSHFLRDYEELHQGQLGILDRTPEISESIYGTLRGNARTSFMYEAYGWMHTPIFMIFCQGHPEGFLRGIHRDAEDNALGDPELRVLTRLYDLTSKQIRMSWLRGGSANFRTVEYSRYVRSGWITLLWALNEWLVMQYPEMEDEISKALSYSIDSAFPMPKETF